VTCDECREGLSDVVDGVESADIAGHLRACAACSALFASMQEAVGILATWSAAPPEGLADRVLARIPQARPLPRAVRLSRAADLRRVAGWALVLGGLAWQLGGGALAARAMSTAAPMIADARQGVERVRKGGITSELERASSGLSALTAGVRSTRDLLRDPS
jgi:predicted anti-sigma-YlaC factor YlaD